MINEPINNLPMLAALGITKTRFVSIIVDGNAGGKGISLGQGECKAVLLKPNYYQTGFNGGALNPSDTTNNQGVLFYYGDARQQTFEYLLHIPLADSTGATSFGANIRTSELIVCSDLNEVWLRVPNLGGDLAPYYPTIEVQAIVYY